MERSPGSGIDTTIPVELRRESRAGIVHYVLSHDKTIPPHPGVGRMETVTKEPQGAGENLEGEENSRKSVTWSAVPVAPAFTFFLISEGKLGQRPRRGR